MQARAHKDAIPAPWCTIESSRIVPEANKDNIESDKDCRNCDERCTAALFNGSLADSRLAMTESPLQRSTENLESLLFV